MSGYSRLQTEDEHEAFGFFLEWRKEFSTEKGDEFAPLSKSRGLLEVLEMVLRRPAMYLGEVVIAKLWAFVKGFEWAEIDHGVQSLDMHRVRGFSSWIAERYHTNRPWFAIFRSMQVGSAMGDIQHFQHHFAMYLEGASPDAPYEHEQKILAVSLDAAVRASKDLPSKE